MVLPYSLIQDMGGSLIQDMGDSLIQDMGDSLIQDGNTKAVHRIGSSHGVVGSER